LTGHYERERERREIEKRKIDVRAKKETEKDNTTGLLDPTELQLECWQHQWVSASL